MLIKILIKNYFERNGSFKGLETTDIFQEIQEKAQSANKTTKAFLYEELGYTAIGGCSAFEVYEIRRAIAECDLQTLKKYFKEENIEEIRQAASILGIKTKTLRKKKIKVKEDFKELVKVLFTYFKESSDCTVPVEIEGSIQSIRLADYVQIELSKNSNIEDGINHLTEIMDKITFKAVVGKGPIISNNVFVIPNKITNQERKYVINTALTLLITDISYLPKAWVKDFGNILFKNITDEKNYLDVLDLCYSSEKTYKELLSDLGINVPDYLKSYELLGVAFFTLGNDIYVINNNCTKNNLYFNFDVNQFSNLASSDSLKTFGDTTKQNIKKSGAF